MDEFQSAVTRGDKLRFLWVKKGEERVEGIFASKKEEKIEIDFDNGKKKTLSLEQAYKLRVQWIVKYENLLLNVDYLKAQTKELFTKKGVDKLAHRPFNLTCEMFWDVMKRGLWRAMSCCDTTSILWVGAGNGEELSCLVLCCAVAGFDLNVLAVEIDEVSFRQCVDRLLKVSELLAIRNTIVDINSGNKQFDMTFNNTRIRLLWSDVTWQSIETQTTEQMVDGADIVWTTNTSGLHVDKHVAKLAGLGQQRRTFLLCGLKQHIWDYNYSDICIWSEWTRTPKSWPTLIIGMIKRNHFLYCSSAANALTPAKKGKGQRQARKRVKIEEHEPLGRGKRVRN